MCYNSARLSRKEAPREVVQEQERLFQLQVLGEPRELRASKTSMLAGVSRVHGV